MPTSAYSQTDLRRREPPFAASERAGETPALYARGGSTSGATHERNFLGTVAALAFAAALATTLFIGWRDSEEGHLTPESGVGYWLGICGASAMLLLLLYPLRKRMKALRGFGSLSAWFRIHMMLGLIGPALILLHCNFKLGSLNSTVALFSMLTVAASGLIGRYLYSRVHLGLYGRRAQIDELFGDVSHLRSAIEGEHSLSAVLLRNLDTHMKYALAERNGVVSSFLALLGHHLRSPGQRARLMDRVKHHI